MGTVCCLTRATEEAGRTKVASEEPLIPCATEGPPWGEKRTRPLVETAGTLKIAASLPNSADAGAFTGLW